jgi:hypothetical protein
MTEQRLSDRHSLEETSVAVVDLESGVEFSGEASNVSGSGLKFNATMEPPVGAEMRVTLKGQENRSARLEVTRVERKSQCFEIAGRFSR